MRANIISVLVFFVLIGGCSNDERLYLKEYNDLKNLKLKGKVKSIRSYYYNAIENFGKIIKGERESENSWNDEEFIVFNRSGDKTEMKTYNPGDFFYNRKYIYEYDENGNIITKSKYKSYGRLKTKYIYKYDNKGNNIEENCYYSSGKLYKRIINKYDDEGNKVERNVFESNGSHKSKETYKYDDKGNKIASRDSSNTHYYPRYFSDSMKIYKYDNKRNLVESGDSLFRNQKWSYSKFMTTKFDDMNNAIEYFLDDGIIISFEYEFDIENNWVKKIEFEDKIPKYIVERVINYYN